MNWGGIVSKEITKAFPDTIINAHSGKLPEYRGMNCIEWAVFNGDEIYGTIHYISEGIDTGDIIIEKKFSSPKIKGLDLTRKYFFKKVKDLIPLAISKLSDKKAINLTKNKGESKQWFVMHPRLKEITERRLVKRLKNKKY